MEQNEGVGRVEFQAKTRELLSVEDLLARGVEILSRGSGKSTDVYLRHPNWRNESWRIRVEGDTFTLTKKGKDRGNKVRVKPVVETTIDKDESDRLRHKYGELVRVNFTYQLFQFHGAVISLDDVAVLGKFLEVSSVDTEEKALEIFDALGIERGKIIKESYFDLMLAENLPAWERALIRVNSKISALTFGVTSGILTTVGALICVYGATNERLALIAAVVGIAVSDSWSDAYSMFRSRLADGCNFGAALRHALATMVGKVVMPAIFVVPLISMPLGFAVGLDLVIGACVLALMSVLQALAARESWWKQLFGNLGIATFIVAMSIIGGCIVHYYLG